MSQTSDPPLLSDEMLDRLNRLHDQAGQRKDGMILISYNAVLIWINRVKNLEQRLAVYRKDKKG